MHQELINRCKYIVRHIQPRLGSEQTSQTLLWLGTKDAIQFRIDQRNLAALQIQKITRGVADRTMCRLKIMYKNALLAQRKTITTNQQSRHAPSKSSLDHIKAMGVRGVSAATIIQSNVRRHQQRHVASWHTLKQLALAECRHKRHTVHV